MVDDIFVIIMECGLTFVARPVPADNGEIGEPDWKLVDPVVIMGEDKTPIKDRLVRYPPRALSDEKSFLIHSDKILTMVRPNKELLSEYLVATSD